jgi:hypothetical protein
MRLVRSSGRALAAFVWLTLLLVLWLALSIAVGAQTVLGLDIDPIQIVTRRVIQPTRHEPTRNSSVPLPRTTHDTVFAPVVPRPKA